MRDTEVTRISRGVSFIPGRGTPTDPFSGLFGNYDGFESLTSIVDEALKSEPNDAQKISNYFAVMEDADSVRVFGFRRYGMIARLTGAGEHVDTRPSAIKRLGEWYVRNDPKEKQLRELAREYDAR